MANYCYTTYIVEGKKETLNKFKDVINNVSKLHEKDGTNNMGDILIELGLYATEEELIEATQDYFEDTPEGLGVFGCWNEAEIVEIYGQTVLTFREEYRWNCSCNMEAISKLPEFMDAITDVYRYSEECGCGIYETTDKERKYFTDEYIRSLGYEPEGIQIASGMSAGEYRKIAQQIVKEQMK